MNSLSAAVSHSGSLESPRGFLPDLGLKQCGQAIGLLLCLRVSKEPGVSVLDILGSGLTQRSCSPAPADSSASCCFLLPWFCFCFSETSYWSFYGLFQGDGKGEL